MLCINYTNGGTFSTSFIAPSALSLLGSEFLEKEKNQKKKRKDIYIQFFISLFVSLLLLFFCFFSFLLLLFFLSL
nr:MAG TPA: type VI secretion protein [Caudoviricetes sp.]